MGSCMKGKNKSEFVYMGMMLVIGIAFFFFLGESGPIMGADGMAYLEYTDFNGVMPAYPFFITVIRFILGETYYLYGVFISQGIIALTCSLYLVVTVRKNYALKNWEMVLMFIMSLLPYAYSLPEYVVTHEIMTESLAFSVFYLFLTCIIKGISAKELKSILIGAIPLLGLILLRSQLLFMSVAYLGAILYLCVNQRLIKNKIVLRKVAGILFLALLIVIATFAIRSQVVGKAKNSQLVNAFFGKAMYIIDEEDYLYFKDATMQEKCKRLFESMDETGRRWEYAKKGLLKWEDVIVGQNENRKLGNDVLYEYYMDTAPQLSYWEKLELVEADKTVIIKTILVHNIGDLLKMYLCMLPSGFLCMVFIQKRSIYLLCNIYGAIFYATYIGLLWKTHKEGKKKEFEFSLLILAVSALNVLCTNIIMYGMQRYLVYTFGMLYIAMYMMLRSLYGRTCRGKTSTI